MAASKVNKKFIAVLGVAVLAVAVGALGLAYTMAKKSGEDLARKGDEFMAAGETEKAVLHYSMAVNKDQRNVAYLNKWIEAMRKWTPAERQEYLKQYFEQYLAAINALADAQRTEVAPQRAVLEEDYQRFRRGGGRLDAWESMVDAVNRAIALFPDNPKADVLRRYRGFSRVAMLRLGAEVSDEAIAEAREDFIKSLAQEPDDEDAAVNLFAIESTIAERLRAKQEVAKAEEALDAAAKRLRDFATANAPAPESLFTLLRLQLARTAQSLPDSATASVRSLLEANKPLLLEGIEAVKATKPEEIELGTAIFAAQYAEAGLENGKAIGEELIAHAASGRETDPAAQIALARRDILGGKPLEAVDRLQRVVELPDKPISLDGVLLFGQRAEAVQWQAEAMLVAWETSTDAAKKPEFITRARAYREALVERIGANEPTVIFLDARLAYTADDYITARTLLAKYNDATAGQDPRARLMLGEILRRQRNYGAAETEFKRVLELDRLNFRAAVSLADIYVQMQNYTEAARYFEFASTLRPGDEDLKKQLEAVQQLVKGGRTQDPVVKAVRDWEELVRGVNPDFEAAAQLLRSRLPASNNDPRLLMALAQTLSALGDRAGALEAVKLARTKEPGNKALQDMEKVLSFSDPLAGALALIDQMEATELQKHVFRYQAYKQFSKQAEAVAELSKAGAMAPEDPGIVELLFQEALIAGNKEEMKRLADLAAAKDLDRAGGRLFRARIEFSERRLAEAGATVQAIVEADRFNALAWRLLGAIRLAQNQVEPSIQAFTSALGVRPDDVPSIKGYIRALIAAGRFDDALAKARESESRAISDSEFVELWLSLEANAPGGDKNKVLEVRTAIAQRRPTDMANKGALAEMYLDARRFEEAKPLIDEIQQARPGISSAQLGIRWLARQNRADDAVKATRDWLAAFPEADRTQDAHRAAASMLSLERMFEPAAAILEEGRGRPVGPSGPAMIDVDLGDIAFETRQFPKACEAYERALKLLQKDEGNGIAKRLAESYSLSGEFTKCDQLLEGLGAEGQKDAQVLLILAQSAFGQKQNDRARRYYDQAVAAAPTNDMPYFKRGQFNLATGKFQDAEADFDQSMRLSKNAAAAREMLVEIYISTGRMDQAVERLRQGVAAAPSDDALRLRLINLLLDRQQSTEARDLLDKAIELKPDSIAWLITGGELMEREQRWDDAASYLKRAWEKSKTPEVAFRYVQALLRKRTPDTATAEAVIKTPELEADKYLSLRMSRAWVLLAQNKQQAGLDELKAALSMFSPENAEGVNTFHDSMRRMFPSLPDLLAAYDRIRPAAGYQGWQRIAVGGLEILDPRRLDATLADIEKLYETSQDKKVRVAASRMAGSVYYSSKKDYAKAAEWFRKGLELDENDAELLNNLAFTLARELGQPSEARPYAERAASLAPRSANILDTLGAVYLDLNMLTEAEEALRLAAQYATAEGDKAPVYLHLGQTYIKQGNKLEAERYLNLLDEIVNRSPAVKAQYGEQLTATRKLLAP